MATSFSCKCPEREKPVAERNWRVYNRNRNTSPFERRGGVYSDYSSVICMSCGAGGRTKAKYVHELKSLEESEICKKR